MRFFFSFLFLFISSFLFSQSYLRTIDPDDFVTNITSTDPDWHEHAGHGQFDEVTWVIRPNGIYTQLDFFATISQGDGWSWSGEYEIIWQFDLPANAIVHDSWLWVEDEIVQADVVDFWTATEIYEDIVDRNQDPSLLRQLSNGKHEIRIYPLFEGQSRKIKMSFLLPNQWTEDAVESWLPMDMFRGTSLQKPSLEIIVPIDEEWQNPYIEAYNPDNNGFPGTTHTLSLTEEVSPFYGPVHYLNLPITESNSFSRLDLFFDAPWQENRTYLKTYEEGDDKFFQFAYLPDWQESLADSSSNSVLVLYDINENKTDITKEDMIYALNSKLGQAFTLNDSCFVLASTTAGIQSINSEKLAITYENLSTLKDTYLTLSDSSSLADLLTEAFSIVESDDTFSEIILVTANDAYVIPADAEDFLTEISPLVPSDVPLKIFDLQNQNISVIYEGELTFEGNQTIYNGLTSTDESILYELRNSDQSFYEMLSNEYDNIEELTGLLGLATSLEEGIVYHNQDIYQNIWYHSSRQPAYYQTGRFIGEFPFEAQASLITEEGNFYTQDISIDTSQMTQGDTLLRELWYGNYLRAATVSAQFDFQREEIVEQSIAERVLTPLTAFLALEPGMGGTVCVPCLDNGGGLIINSTNEEKTTFSLEVAPNPAVSSININLEGLNIDSEIVVEIFNLNGQRVEVLEEMATDKTLSIQWNFTEKITSGTYFLRIHYDEKSFTEKVTIIR